jgi:excisionase family DNA binding protein
MTDPPQTPEDKAAKREASRQRELDRIFQAGWDNAADFPPLTDEQIERIAFILNPCVAAPRGSVSPRPKAHAYDEFTAAPLVAVEEGPPPRPKRSKRAGVAAGAVTVYRAEEVAEILRCHKGTLYRLARGKKIGFCPRQPGQSGYRFLQKHIDDFLNGVRRKRPRRRRSPRAIPGPASASWTASASSDASWPPLTAEQVEQCAFIIRPRLAALE